MANKIAILIGAYENQDYLDHLISKMLHPRVNIYVHLNKYNSSQFKGLIAKYKGSSQVHIYDELCVRWGGHTLMESFLFLIKKALNDDSNFYFHAITGSDILTRPINELVQFCDDNENKNFLNYHEMNPQWKFRYSCYDFHELINLRSNRYLRACALGLVRLQYLLHLRRKPLPFQSMMAGSSWWSLNRSAVSYLYEKLMSDNMKKSWKYTFAPDEIFYQCILYNSHFKDTLTGTNLCHLKWTGKSHPKTLTIEDYDIIKRPGIFFARKVHPSQSKELINKIFNEI